MAGGAFTRVVIPRLVVQMTGRAILTEGTGVVKGHIGPFDRVVAGIASVAEEVLVRVILLVAAIAYRTGALKSLIGMAAAAQLIGMTKTQRETGLTMVENRRYPSIGGMTIIADRA